MHIVNFKRKKCKNEKIFYDGLQREKCPIAMYI